jgi:phosphoadenosine phosphosulfate reductase
LLVDYGLKQINGVLEFGIVDKVKEAIKRIKALEPPEGYYLAFSGGKDSQCIYHLAKEAGVKFDAHYNVTTVDPPELIYFIRENYPDVQFNRPELTMWQLIPKKLMPPTRLVRYCCAYFKEPGGAGRFVITGVRWAESVKRKNNRALVELNAYTKYQVMINELSMEAMKLIKEIKIRSSCKHILNPIIDWTKQEVWDFIRQRNIEYCKLYDEGFDRLGCIGCPMSGPMGMEFEFAKYPKYEQAYLRAFARMIEERKKRGLESEWKTPEEVMEWWISGGKQEEGDLFKGEGK